MLTITGIVAIVRGVAEMTDDDVFTTTRTSRLPVRPDGLGLDPRSPGRRRLWPVHDLLSKQSRQQTRRIHGQSTAG
ncbi:hypothetical protein [Streptomyces sp. NPDC046832]|uniref:hypothetical protein n=1 Tax=Streptomyces sp. NPDC046832 TaxID=3155020 RepID=UPI0033EDF7F0